MSRRTLLALLALVSVVLINQLPVYAQPVIAPSQFWFTSGDEDVYIPYAASENFVDTTLTAIDRAVLVFHHGERDAMDVFNIVTGAVAMSFAEDRVLTIAPQLLSPQLLIDNPDLDPGALAWDGDWFYSGESINTDLPPTRSFVPIEEMATEVTESCPNLEVLVFTGHAGGAKLVERLALISEWADEHPDLKVLYHFGNSGGYAYLSEERYDTDAQQWLTPATGLDTTGCVNYDNWPFGLENFDNPQELIDRYESRHVAMMIALQDTSIRGVTCQMLLQTPDESRLQMANLYWEHTQHVYDGVPEKHIYIPLQDVGHVVSHYYRNLYTRHILVNYLQNHVAISIPEDDPMIVPAEGGSFQFAAWVFNASYNPIHVDAWTEIIMPSGYRIRPVHFITVNIPGGEGLRSPSGLTVDVPPGAPPGIYTHVTKFGNYPARVLAQHRFEFAKVPAE
ncbi:hypothetical protein KQI52_09540 [bacterium]|nr:hypothetical protein [bacterium]